VSSSASRAVSVSSRVDRPMRVIFRGSPK
jgi:hypothetical protein